MKKEIKIDKDYWICQGEGCGRKVTSLIQTNVGMRCLKCVMKNNLTFLAREFGFGKWVSNAVWEKE